MASDFALLLREPSTVTVAGVRIHIPYRPAAEWMRALTRLDALAGALAAREARDVLVELLMDHPDAYAQLRAESLRILGEAGGRKWWEVGRLLSTSAQPEILGRLVLAGADPWTRSVGEWCAATYALCVKGQDEKGRLKFDFSLSIPPQEFEDEWDDGDDPAVVLAGLAGLTGER